MQSDNQESTILKIVIVFLAVAVLCLGGFIAFSIIQQNSKDDEETDLDEAMEWTESAGQDAKNTDNSVPKEIPEAAPPAQKNDVAPKTQKGTIQGSHFYSGFFHAPNGNFPVTLSVNVSGNYATAVYKNVKYKVTLNMKGELNGTSLYLYNTSNPGALTLDLAWTGNGYSGTAYSDNNALPVTLTEK